MVDNKISPSMFRFNSSVLIGLSSLAFFLNLIGCSDISMITRGDHYINEGNYSAAIKEYEKVVELTSKRDSPYYGLPTGEEAKKKMEIANLALSSRDQFAKGNQELWKGNLPEAGKHYQEVDTQFLSDEEKATYEKNRAEILTLLAKLQKGDSTPFQTVAPTVPSGTTPAPPEPPEQIVETEGGSDTSQSTDETNTVPEPDVSSYFPLNPGWKYRYRASVPIGKRTFYQNLEEEILPEKTVQGRSVIPVKRTNPNRSSDFHYYQALADQIIQVAEQKTNQAGPTFFELPIIEIKSPVSIGTSWTSQGVSRSIAGLEHVSVVSGQYKNCLKISEESNIVKIIRWYAPKIGLIKEQKIRFPGKTYESQSDMELTQLTR